MIRSTMLRSMALALSVGPIVGQKPVQVVQPLRTDLEDQTNLPGKLIGEARLMLKSRVSGYVAEFAGRLRRRCAAGRSVGADRRS